jgi:hypothetical protein
VLIVTGSVFVGATADPHWFVFVHCAMASLAKILMAINKIIWYLFDGKKILQFSFLMVWIKFILTKIIILNQIVTK